MTAHLKVSNVIAQAKQLSKADQLTLLQQLAALLKKEEAQKEGSVSLTSLSGLGSNIWEGSAKIDEYIETERQW